MCLLTHAAFFFALHELRKEATIGNPSVSEEIVCHELHE